MSWRVADCLEILKAEVDERWPERDTASDGAIGDERHQQDPTSDHNAFIKDSDGVGVVRFKNVARSVSVGAGILR